MYIGPHIKYPLRLSEFNETWITSTEFFLNIPISNFVKILSVGAALFHADKRADW